MNPMEFANRTEALDTLVFMFEDNGLFVTPADLAPLAAKVLEEYSNGIVMLTCEPHELIRRAEALFPEMREPAECAVSWCSGARPAHATFDTDSIEHFTHSERLSLDGELLGWIAQTGSAAPAYVFDASETVSLSAPELRALAAVLLERATQLDSYTGEVTPEGVAR